MRKIVSLFQRNYDGDRLVRDEVVPGAEWVVAGEGVATRKYDGTACLYRAGVLFKRYDAKRGRTPPATFVPAQPNPDPVTGHWPGWVPVTLDAKEDRWHREALDSLLAFYGGEGMPLPEWTYELVGPKVNGNPERYDRHVLVAHGKFRWAATLDGSGDKVPRSFDALKAFLTEWKVEGIVWWRDLSDVDCDKVKVKARDFGLPWPPR